MQQVKVMYVVEFLRLQTHIQNLQRVFLFNYNNGYSIVPQYYLFYVYCMSLSYDQTHDFDFRHPTDGTSDSRYKL